VLKGTGGIARDAYFTWFPHLVPGVSVHQGDWKLIRRFQERPGDYEGTRELFNLKDDLGETTNLAAKMPEKVKELDALIDRFVAETGALLPRPNPDYKPRPVDAGGRVASSDPAAGLVPKSCKVSVVAGALRVEADGRAPFLGTAQVKTSGPLTLKLRARSAAGGAGKVQWVTKDQEDFPKEGQVVPFNLPAGADWQDVTVEIPMKGEARILRLYLPADKGPVEVESIRWISGAAAKAARAWVFSTAKP
jgi:hypothetical protein